MKLEPAPPFFYQIHDGGAVASCVWVTVFGAELVFFLDLELVELCYFHDTSDFWQPN
jgi:hypothetical protein